jgi:DNA-directed RNA polymerase specialized sigma24 family protein
VTVERKGIAERRPDARRRHRQSVPRDGATITAAAVWVQVRARPAAERQVVIRPHLGQLAPREVARLIGLSAATARLDVLERLARRDALCVTRRATSGSPSLVRGSDE